MVALKASTTGRATPEATATGRAAAKTTAPKTATARGAAEAAAKTTKTIMPTTAIKKIAQDHTGNKATSGGGKTLTSVLAVNISLCFS